MLIAAFAAHFKQRRVILLSQWAQFARAFSVRRPDLRAMHAPLSTAHDAGQVTKIPAPQALSIFEQCLSSADLVLCVASGLYSANL